MEKTPREIEKEIMRAEKWERAAAKREAMKAEANERRANERAYRKEYAEKKELDPKLDLSDFLAKKRLEALVKKRGLANSAGVNHERIKKGK